jgi:hypothetical protein
MGCMGNEDLSRIGSLEMTMLLMSVEQRCIQEGGWSARKVASGRSQAEKLSRGNSGHEQFGADKRVGRSSEGSFG